MKQYRCRECQISISMTVMITHGLSCLFFLCLTAFENINRYIVCLSIYSEFQFALHCHHTSAIKNAISNGFIEAVLTCTNNLCFEQN